MGEFSTPDLEALRGDPAPVVTSAPADPAASGTAVGRVLAAHHDRLMAMDGVVMVGQGHGPVGEDAIVVGVRRADQLGGLPRALDGVPVCAEVIGEVDALPAGGPR